MVLLHKDTNEYGTEKFYKSETTNDMWSWFVDLNNFGNEFYDFCDWK